jgi:hypothetical protein
MLPASFIASAQTAGSGSQDIWIPRDQDLRIFEVRVKQYTFTDVVSAYQFEDIVLLPLGALSELLEIAIEVRPGEASGFVIKEDRSFFLDTAREEITLQGEIEKYDRDKVHVLFDDIYVDSNLLGKWMNMSFDVDLFASRIGVRSETPLPFLQRLERDKRISLSLSRLNRDEEEYPRHYEPYQNWGAPFIDQTVRLSRRKTESGDTTYNFDYATYATADLAKHEASLYFSGNETDPTDEFRLTLGRRDPEGGLLGGMDATEYALGNLPEPRVALINQPSSIEPGVTVSNAPLGRQSEFDRHRFIGDLLPGWEVELYRNNVLIGYQAQPVNGLYDFQDVPLLLGSNYFRLEFYGPQGQTRTEETRFDLDQSQTPKGEQYYGATVTEDEIDGNRAVLQYNVGITKRLSLTTNLVSIPLDEFDERKQHNYLDVGLKTYGDKFYLTFDAINDTESGDALDFSMQTRFNDVILGITETLLNDFFSEEFRPTDVQLSRRSKYRLDAAIPPGVLPRIPISFEYTRDEYAEGGGLRRLDNLISFNARGIAISNLLTYQEITDQDPIGNGSLQLSSNYSDIRLRGTVSYEMLPDNELTNLFLTADPGQIGDYLMSVGLSHTLEGNLSEFSVSANKSSGRYNLSLGARYNTDDEVTLDASLSVGFGREPRREDWSTDARMLASSGSVSARVFIDTNQDGIYNANDESIPDIGFRVGGGMNNQRTDEDGIAFLTGLPVHQSLSITIAPETIADPSWTVALDGVSVIPRPGHTILLDFPIFISGEIDGTVYVERGDRQLGAGRVTIELVDSAGRVVRTAVTAYDGFYVMDKIPFGEYRLRVSEKQLADLGQVAKKIDNLSITYESQFHSGLDFILREVKP